MTSVAAFTGAMVISGGIAEGAHVLNRWNQNTADATGAIGASGASTSSASDNVAQDVANRAAVTGQANRDAQRAPLTPGASASASGAAAGTSASAIGSSPFRPTSSPSMGQTTAATATSTVGPVGATKTSIPAIATSTPKPTTSTTTKPSASSTPSSSVTAHAIGATPAQAKAIARQLVPSGQFLCFSNIIMHESSWNIYARNASSGAYGLGQALPASKMATVASDWSNDAVTQIKWALQYMNSRYGSPCSAWSFWQAHDWY